MSMSSVEDTGKKLADARLTRRRVVQGLAAAPLVAAGATRGVRSVSAQSKTTIKFWTHTHPPMIDQNKALIQQFQAANPDIEVQYDIIPNNDFATKMLTSMGTGTGPDVINMDDNQMRAIYIPKGLVQPLDAKGVGYDSDDALQKAYIPGALEGSVADGKVYGLPSEFNVTAFAINTDEFTKAGLDPKSPPKTWEEMGTEGQKLVVKDGDTLTQRGFDFLYLHAGWYHNQLGTLLLQTGGRYVADDNKTVLVNKPEAVAALQIWYDMIYKYKIADPNVAGRDATVPYQDFLDGKVASTLLNPWGMALVTKDSAVYNKYAVVPLPQVNPNAGANPLYAYYWAVNSQTKDPAKLAAAFKWVAFLASQPGEWLKNVNFIQPKVGWEQSAEAKAFPFFDVWASEMLKGKFLPITPQSQQVDDIMKATIESSVLNGEDPQSAMDNAAQQIDAVIKQGS
jgi:ABC-type glycerol-3-phosphate transport system substrate-binding protein